MEFADLTCARHISGKNVSLLYVVKEVLIISQIIITNKKFWWNKRCYFIYCYIVMPINVFKDCLKPVVALVECLFLLLLLDFMLMFTVVKNYSVKQKFKTNNQIIWLISVCTLNWLSYAHLAGVSSSFFF